MNCGVEVTESSTNKQHHLSLKDCKVIHTEIKYILMDEIIRNNDQHSARMQWQALYNFLGQLYTMTPISATNMQHLLGPEQTDGWTSVEHKQLELNFTVYKTAQDAEEVPINKSGKGEDNK
jgi:hypothetical protein